MIRTLLAAGVLFTCLFGAQGHAAETVEGCLEKYGNDEIKRLKCYDDIARQRQKSSTPSTTVAPSPAQTPKLEMQASTPAAVPKPPKQDTTPVAAVAAGNLAGCKGEIDPAERLRCYDDAAHYSWWSCRLSCLRTQESPVNEDEGLDSCKTTCNDSERLYKYDLLAGFKAVAAGNLDECKGKIDPAERLSCYDKKAKYSWPMCMFTGQSWIKEPPGKRNACKYFFEATERLYGYDELAGYKPPQPVSPSEDTERLNGCDDFKPTTPEKRYKPSYLSIKWRLNEGSRQLDEKRRFERYVESRIKLEEKLQQLNEENQELYVKCSPELEMKIRQLNEENSRALEEENRLGRLALAYRLNYILFGTYNFHPDKQLWESANGGKELQDYEAKFQLSLKLRIWKDILGDWERHLGMHIDLWLAYTQLSFWQIYNASISRPFRETNYEPELILNGRMDKDLFYDWKLRFIQIALNHQSNGQSDPLSRSWNRLMFNFGFERENFDVVLKTWYRFPESTNDDNPDIESYLGYGELSAGYRRNLCGVDWRFSLMFRNNLRFDNENRSALQLGVEANLFGPLNLYIQYFTGYGESLINYNSYANTIGAGVSVKDW